VIRRNVETLGGGRYRVRKVVRAKQYERVFSSREAARAYLQHLELLSAGVPVRDGPSTLGQVITAYNARLVRLGRSPETVAYYDKIGRHLIRELGEEHPYDLAPYEVDGYVDRRLAGKAGQAAVMKELAAYKAMLRAAELPVGWRAPQLRPVHRHKRLPTDDEIARVLDASPSRVRRALLIGLLTGIRASEILALDWKDVDLPAGTLRVTLKKVAWENVLPLVRTLARELAGGGIGPVIGLTKNQVAHTLRGIGSPFLGLGITRHLVVTAVMDAGYTEGQVALLTGHVAGVTRRHYAHSSGSLEVKRAMLEVVEKRYTMGTRVVGRTRAKTGKALPFTPSARAQTSR
jgi:integrase